MPDTIERLIAVGRPDLAERLKHLAGKHNQSRHGWRFAKGGDDAAKLGAARRSMRGRDAGERAEYRKRAGMPEAKPLERKQPADHDSATKLPVGEIKGKTTRQVAKKKVVVEDAVRSAIEKANQYKLSDRDRDEITSHARYETGRRDYQVPERQLWEIGRRMAYVRAFNQATGSQTSPLSQALSRLWDWSSAQSIATSSNNYLWRRVAGMRSHWSGGR